MLEYNIMYEAINDKYINGELTYEQANELNIIAFEKYSEPYSKTEEDRFLREYESKVYNIKKAIVTASNVNKENLDKNMAEAMFKKIEKSIDEVEGMLRPGYMPTKMSYQGAHKSEPLARVIGLSLLAAFAVRTATQIKRKISLKEQQDYVAKLQNNYADKLQNNYEEYSDKVEKNAKKFHDEWEKIQKRENAAYGAIAAAATIKGAQVSRASTTNAAKFRLQQKWALTQLRAELARVKTICLS